MQYQCELCSTNQYEDEQLVFYKLPCGNIFCTPCLNEMLRNNIEHKDPMLKCPGCSKELDIQQLQGYVDDFLFSNFCDVLFEKDQVKLDNELEKQYTCFSCSLKYIHVKDKIIRCPRCLKFECTLCFAEAHGNTICPDNNREEILKNNPNISQCPECKMLVEKTEGCLFMRCRNYKCLQKKIHFCFQCKKKLEIGHHYTHYENRDPYKGRCLEVHGKDEVESQIIPGRQDMFNQIMELLLGKYKQGVNFQQAQELVDIDIEKIDLEEQMGIMIEIQEQQEQVKQQLIEFERQNRNRQKQQQPVQQIPPREQPQKQEQQFEQIKQVEPVNAIKILHPQKVSTIKIIRKYEDHHFCQKCNQITYQEDILKNLRACSKCQQQSCRTCLAVIDQRTKLLHNTNKCVKQ